MVDVSSNNPRVSVIMANFNNGRFIEDAIKSVMSQTYTNWEIVIVDDGSTDNSRDVLNRYIHQENIKIYFNESNRGVGYTKRKCVDKSFGDLCAILDTDDILSENALETVVKAFAANPDAVMVVGGFEYYDITMENIIRQKYYKKNTSDKSILEYGFAFGWDVFSRKAYYQTEGFDEKQTADDQDLYFKLEEVGKILFLDKYLYKYRQHGEGISQKFKGLNVFRDHLIAIENANKRRRKSGDRRIIDPKKLRSRWEEYYIRKTHKFFFDKEYKNGYRTLWKSFRVCPSSRLFLKLNLLLHPLKIWKVEKL